MGTDIHIEVQVQQLDGAWKRVPRPNVREDRNYAWHKWFFDRNYELFSALAGVRNRGGIGIFKEPTGWPEDVEHLFGMSTEKLIKLGLLTKEEEYLDAGDHSFTTYTLQELLDCPWRTHLEQLAQAHSFDEEEDAHLDAYPEWARNFVRMLHTQVRPLHPDPSCIRLLISFDS